MRTKPLSRRTLLRGLGASIALPSLEAMLPTGRAAAAAGATTPPLRMGYVYLPNGVNVDKWKPGKTGSGNEWQLSETLSPLKDAKSQLQVLGGFKHDKAWANGDGGGDHARATATFLTGQQAKKTAGADIRLGISVDQLAAEQVRGQTRLDSLQLGCDPARKAGRCDSGYSCAYQFNFSWKSENLPLAPEIDPRSVFELLFGDTQNKSISPERRKALSNREKSVLDYALEDAKSLQSKLGYTDQQKLEEYFTGVRELERRIENAEKFRQLVPDDASRPTGIPDTYQEHIRVMYDLMALAFQTDNTRIATFLVAHDGSNRSFREIGVPDAHHHLSHHRRDAEKMEKIQKIDRFYVEQFAYFLKRMRELKETDGSSLLDHSMIVFGGGIADGDKHSHNDLPILLAGKGNGHLTPDRHLRVDDVPMTNLYRGMLEKFGTPVERIGDSTGVYSGV